MHPVKGFANAAARNQRAMIAQDQCLAIAQVAHQRFLFVVLEHHAHIVVIADLQEAHGRLGNGQQTAIERRSEEHTSELQSLMRISYAVFCLNKNKHKKDTEAYKNTIK